MAMLCRRINSLVGQLRIPISAAIEHSKHSFRFTTRMLPSVCASSSKASPPTINDKLMEFFDDPKNWEADNVKCGKSWSKDELRIKSNEDLHKLWFVLLKEKNMLLTMEHECKREFQVLPSPERRDKVEESMENLEAVVRERNKAYFELETTENSERPGKYVYNQIGMRYFYRQSEHFIPKFMNRKFRSEVIHGYTGRAVNKFLKLWREKNYSRHAYIQHSKRKQVSNIFRYMPHVSEEAIKEAYPDVDIQKARDHKDALGNHGNNSA